MRPTDHPDGIRPGQLGPGAPDVDYSKLSQIRALLGEHTAKRLIGLFYAELDDRPVLIENAARCGRQEEVRQQAHALFGAAANIGAVRLAELARSFELGELAPSESALDELRSAVAAARDALDRFPDNLPRN